MKKEKGMSVSDERTQSLIRRVLLISWGKLAIRLEEWIGIIMLSKRDLYFTTAANTTFYHNCQLTSLFPTSNMLQDRRVCLIYMSSILCTMTLSYKVVMEYLLNGWINTFTHQGGNRIILFLCLKYVSMWGPRKQILKPK